MRTLKVSQDNLHARIIEQVRSGRATSRGVLAKKLSVAPSTMGLYVDQLIATGWLRESGLVRGRTGRPKMNLEIVAEGTGWFAGVEFTGSRIQVIAVDFAGHQRHALTRVLPVPSDAETVVRQVELAIQDMAGRMADKLLGIGVGAPGLVNPDTGIAIYSMTFPDWKDVPLRDRLARAFGVPCTIHNNLRAIAWAERWFGGGRDADDYVVLGPRSGFAMAVMKNGRLIVGAHLAAGEIGFWPLGIGGTEAPIHHQLSSPAIWRTFAGVKKDAPVPSDLHEALAGFSDLTGEAWDEVTTLFAKVIGMTQCLIDAKLYFLHGPLIALGERFCREIVQKAVGLMPALKDMPFEIQPSTLGDDAGALGAASLAMEAWDPGL